MENMYFCMDMQQVPCHEQVLLRWVRQAEAALWEEEPALPVSRGARSRLSALLFQRLEAVAAPALNALLQERLSRSNPIAALNVELVPISEREAASAALLEELESSDLAPLKKMPVLLQWLDRSTVQYTDMIRLMLARTAHRSQEIAEAFFSYSQLGEITDVSCDGSDLHENGQCAVILTTARGKFLYKSHDCRTDALYAQCIERYFSDITLAPRCVTGDGYGFCEFIQARRAEQEDDIRRYYRNFGNLAALFQALGSSDLHIENFLAVGDRPVLIDLETLLTPSPKVFGETPQQGKLSIFTDALNHSLYPSSLLPYFAGGRDLSPLMNQEQNSRCLPVRNGTVQTVQSYMTDFLSGFEDGYRRCIRLRRELEMLLDSFRNIRVRRLLRHTNFYAVIQRKLLLPGALVSAEAQKAVTCRLRMYFEQAHAPHLYPVAQAEETALLRGDIPYFYSMGNSCDLMVSGDVVVTGYFQYSGVENARRRIARMNEEELRFEKKLLSSAIRQAVVPLPEGEQRTLPDAGGPRMLTQEQFYAEAETLMTKICDHALTVPDGAVGWVTNLEGKTGVMQPELMQGTAGLGIFLSACVSSGMVNAKPYADACLDNLDGYLYALEQGSALQLAQLQMGLGGAAGVLRALRMMQRHMPEAEGLHKRFRALLDRMDLENAGVDSISGAAGLLQELCASPLASDHDLIRRCAQSLLQTKKLIQPHGAPLWDTLGKKRPISGMGHGMAGIGAALVQAYDTLGAETWLRAAQDAFAWESQIYSEKLGTWPDLRTAGTLSAMHGYCSGAPGIGLALLSCGKHRAQIPDWEKNLARATNACLNKDIRFRDHLCCGNSAVADFLLEAGRREGQEELTLAARMLLSQMALRKLEDYSYLPASYQPTFWPSLFYGAAGIGYTILRAINSDLPSVLIG